MRRLLKDAAKAERPIVAAGIDGLEPGLAMVLDDPRKWNDKDADGNYLVPDGSIIYVDEAWKWFGHLQDASRQATPPHVVALAEHRHRGLDFVWTTQMPNQLYPFVRGLIGAHTHCVRRFGTQFVDNFSNGIGLNISVPIFNGGAARTSWKRAKLNVTNYELQKQQDNLVLKQDIYQAYTDAVTALQKFNASTKTVEAAQKAFDFANKRYNVGLLNTIDLITSQNNLFSARLQRLQAQFDYVFRMKVLEFYKGQGLKL